MKDSFLVHITLPDFFTLNFHQLIASQRSLIEYLLEDGVIKSYSLDMARKNLWINMQAVDEKEVMDILSTFPIIKQVKVEIHELAFCNLAPTHLPDLSLN